jgi:hypothetical protein
MASACHRRCRSFTPSTFPNKHHPDNPSLLAATHNIEIAFPHMLHDMHRKSKPTLTEMPIPRPPCMLQAGWDQLQRLTPHHGLQCVPKCAPPAWPREAAARRPPQHHPRTAAQNSTLWVAAALGAGIHHRSSAQGALSARIDYRYYARPRTRLVTMRCICSSPPMSVLQAMQHVPKTYHVYIILVDGLPGLACGQAQLLPTCHAPMRNKWLTYAAVCVSAPLFSAPQTCTTEAF